MVTNMGFSAIPHQDAAGVVYIAESPSTTLRAISPAFPLSPIWTSTLPGPIASSHIAIDESAGRLVVVVNSPSRVCWVETSDGSVAFCHSGGAVSGALQTPMLGNAGEVVVCTVSPGNCYSFTAAGVMRWARSMPGDVNQRGLIAADGEIYQPSYGWRMNRLSQATGNLVYSQSGSQYRDPVLLDADTLVCGSDGSKVQALPLSTGLPAEWEATQPTNRVFGGPAVSPSGDVFVVSWDHNAYSFTPTGALRWAKYIGGSSSVSPTLFRDASRGLFRQGNDGHILNLATGAPNDTFSLGASINRPMVLADDTLLLFAGSDLHHIVPYSIVFLEDRVASFPEPRGGGALDTHSAAIVRVRRGGLDDGCTVTVDLRIAATGNATGGGVDFDDTDRIALSFGPSVTTIDVEVDITGDRINTEDGEGFVAWLENLVLVTPDRLGEAHLADYPFNTTYVTIVDTPVVTAASSWPRPHHQHAGIDAGAGGTSLSAAAAALGVRRVPGWITPLGSNISSTTGTAGTAGPDPDLAVLCNATATPGLPGDCNVTIAASVSAVIGAAGDIFFAASVEHPLAPGGLHGIAWRLSRTDGAVRWMAASNDTLGLGPGAIARSAAVGGDDLDTSGLVGPGPPGGGSGDLAIAIGEMGIARVSAETGAAVWTETAVFAGPGPAAWPLGTRADPVVFNGTVLAVSPPPAPSQLIALSGATGAVLASVPLPRPVLGSPVVCDDGIVLIGDESGHVLAVNTTRVAAVPGAVEVLWDSDALDSAGNVGITAAPLVLPTGNIIVVRRDGVATVLEPLAGEAIIPPVATGLTNVTATPTLSDDASTIYLADSGGVGPPGGTNQVAALHAANLTALWTSPPLGGPIAGGSVALGPEGTLIVALGAGGSNTAALFILRGVDGTIAGSYGPPGEPLSVSGATPAVSLAGATAYLPIVGDAGAGAVSLHAVNPSAVVFIAERDTITVSEHAYEISLTVMRDGVDTQIDLSVDVVFVDGTATGGRRDYVSDTQTVRLAPGVTSAVISVSILTDFEYGEPDETFQATLSNLVVHAPGIYTFAHVADSPFDRASVVIRDTPSPFAAGSSWPTVSGSSGASHHSFAAGGAPPTVRYSPPFVSHEVGAPSSCPEGPLRPARVASDGSYRVVGHAGSVLFALESVRGDVAWNVSIAQHASTATVFTNCSARGPPSVDATGNAYLVTQNGSLLIRVGPAGGSPVWSHALGPENVTAVPVLGPGDGTVLVPAAGLTLRSIDAATGSTLDEFVAPLATAPGGVEGDTLPSRGAALSAWATAVLWNGTDLVSLNVSSPGDPAPAGQWATFVSPVGPVRAGVGLFAAGDTAAVTDAAPHQLLRVSRNGSLVWSVPVPDGALDATHRPAVGPDDSVWVGTASGAVLGLNPNGSVRVSFPSGAARLECPSIQARSRPDDFLVVFVGSDAVVRAVHGTTGAVVWSHTFSAAAGASPPLAAASPIAEPDGSVTARIGATLERVVPYSIVYFESSTYSASESDLWVTLTVIRGGVDTSPHLTVDVVLTDGTATSAPFGDYEHLGGSATTTLDFPAGVTSVQLRVPVRPDFDPAEGDETFTAALTGLVVVTPGTLPFAPRIADATSSTAIITITDGPIASHYYPSSWPRYMRDSRNSGCASTTARRCPPFALPFNDADYATPSIGPDGVVYIGDDAGVLHAFDQCGGAALWTYTIGGGSISAAPAIGADGTLYLGSTDNKFHAVFPNGTTRWSLTVGGAVLGDAAIGKDGVVFFGSFDDYKLMARDGNDGSEVFTLTLPTKPTFSGIVVGGDGFIYLSGSTGALVVSATQFGVHRWTSSVGMLWDPRGSSALTPDHRRIIHGGHATLRAFDATNGLQLETTNLGSLIWTSPVFDAAGDIIVASTRMHKLDPFSISSPAIWTDACCRNYRFSSPTLSPDRGTVYMGSTVGLAVAVDVATGADLWTLSIGTVVKSASTVAPDGSLYVMADGTFNHIVPYPIVYFDLSAAASGFSFAEAALVAAVPVTRGGMDTAAAFTVDVVITAGTATGAGVDFDDTTVTVSFAAGETVKMANIALVHDSVVEATETFSLRLDNLAGSPAAVIAEMWNETTVNITDSPDPVSVPVAPSPPAVSVTTYPASGFVQVSWPLPNNATAGNLPITAYTLRRDGVVIATIAAPALAYTDTGPLNDNTVYTYTLSLNNTLGAGPPSAGNPATTGYRQPAAVSVIPTVVPSAGGSSVTLTGSFFGAGPGSVSAVFIDGVNITQSSWISSTQLVFVAPPLGTSATGPSVPVAVATHLGGLSTSTAALVYGSPPNITAVQPPNSGAVESRIVGIAGHELGSAQADVVSVSLAGVPCQSVAWTNSSHLDCTAGVSVSGATSGPVVVTTASGGVGTYTTVPFAFTAPSVTAVEPATVLAGSTGAASTVTLHGSYMGASAADLDLAGFPVNVSAAPSGPWIPCVSTLWVSESQVVCTMDPASTVSVGDLSLVIATVPGGVSTPTPTVPAGSSMLTISIAPVGSLPNVTAIVPNAGPDTGGTTVTLHGASFGSVSSPAVSSVTLAAVACGSVVRISDVMVTCVAGSRPAGPISGPVVVTTVAGTSTVITGLTPVFTYVPTSTVPLPPAIVSFAPASAAMTGGAVVAIRGTSLGIGPTDVLAVTVVGAACASVTYVSSTRLDCTVAAVTAPGEGPVTVTTSSGGSAIGALKFTYYDPTVIEPRVTGVAPSRGPTSGGIPATIHGITFGSQASHIAGVRFGTASATSVTFIDSGTITCELPAHANAAVVDVVVSPTDTSNPTFPGQFWYMGEPTLTAVTPSVITLAEGGMVTLHGLHWDDTVEITVEGALLGFANVSRTGNPTGVAQLAAGNETVQLRAHAGPGSTLEPKQQMMGDQIFLHPQQQVLQHHSLRNMQSQDPQALPGPGEDSNRPGAALALLQPVHLRADGGYHVVTVRNVITGAKVSSDTFLFATNDCPEPGQFGTGKDCKPCPDGGTCPGGNRVWPKQGYWNPGEDSGYIVRCEPPESCLGTKGALCAGGYEGDLCGKCSEEFYRGNNRCNPCPESTSVIIFIIGDCVVWISFALAAVLIRDRNILSYCVMVVRSLQMLSGLGSSAEGKDMPGWVLTIYSVLHIFSGDYSFIKPDCVSPVPFEQQFGVSIAYNIGVFVPVWIALAVAHCLASPAGECDEEGWIPTADQPQRPRTKVYWRDRAVRMLVIWLTVMYLPVTALALETLSCVPIGSGGRYQMITRPHEACYVGNHVFVTAAASLLLAAYTIGFPIAMLRWVKKDAHADLLHFSERFMERWNFLYEFYNIKNPTFWLIEFPIGCVIAAGKSLLQPHVNFQMSISCAVFLYKLGYIIVRRPFIDWMTDLIQAVLSIVSLIAINMTFLSRHGVFDGVPALSLSFGIGVVVLIAVVVVGLVIMIAVLLMTPAEDRRDPRGVKEDDEPVDASSFAQLSIANMEGWTTGGEGDGGNGNGIGDGDTGDDGSELSFVSRISGFLSGVMGGIFGDGEDEQDNANDRGEQGHMAEADSTAMYTAAGSEIGVVVVDPSATADVSDAESAVTAVSAVSVRPSALANAVPGQAAPAL